MRSRKGALGSDLGRPVFDYAALRRPRTQKVVDQTGIEPVTS
jgi:hypothetical protein